jgi:Flp pilus assembly protein TadD
VRGWLRGVVGLLVGLLACASPVHQRPWLRVRSPNFEIWSELGAEESRELARNLEFFRAVVDRTTGANLEPRVASRVYAFRDRPTLVGFASVSWAAGFFAESMRGNVVVLAPGRRGQAREILQHEYVHYILHNGAVVYPTWYDEGFADFLGTTRVHGDRVEVGRVPDGIRYLDGWIPVEQILEAREIDAWPPGRVYMFYVESWALVHYLHFGLDAGEPVPARLGRYLRATAAGTAPDEAFEAAFGLSVRELDRALQRYVKKRRFAGVSLPADAFPAPLDPEVEPADPAEVAEALGRLSLAADKGEQARHYFEAALALDPAAARAQTGLGEIYARDGRWNEADTAFARALAVAPEDALVQLDYAEHLQRHSETAESPEALAVLLARARRHYVRSWEADPAIPETYAMYGSTFLADGEDPARGLATLEHAQRLLPSNLEIKLLLARTYARVGRRDAARELALTALGWAHEPETKQAARDLLAELEASPLPASTQR